MKPKYQIGQKGVDKIKEVLMDILIEIHPMSISSERAAEIANKIQNI